MKRTLAVFGLLVLLFSLGSLAVTTLGWWEYGAGGPDPTLLNALPRGGAPVSIDFDLFEFTFAGAARVEAYSVRFAEHAGDGEMQATPDSPSDWHLGAGADPANPIAMWRAAFLLRQAGDSDPPEMELENPHQAALWMASWTAPHDPPGGLTSGGVWDGYSGGLWGVHSGGLWGGHAGGIGSAGTAAVAPTRRNPAPVGRNRGGTGGEADDSDEPGSGFRGIGYMVSEPAVLVLLGLGLLGVGVLRRRF